MYQQPLARTFSTAEVFKTLHVPAEDDIKLTAHDAFVTLAQVSGVLLSCWALHSAFV